MALGSMKRTSSRMTSNSDTSSTPAVAEPLDERADELLRGARARGDPDGADALEPRLVELVRVVDEVRGAPCSWATCTRRTEFEEFFEPMTRTRSHCSAICLTADWRFVVA
jgi:hypothetical protein